MKHNMIKTKSVTLLTVIIEGAQLLRCSLGGGPQSQTLKNPELQYYMENSDSKLQQKLCCCTKTGAVSLGRAERGLQSCFPLSLCYTRGQTGWYPSVKE